ncbi:hypothetical protein [Pseudomonas sp. EL_65y_Pfl2_R96]|uniref:hypothetical protein n=1 Tax=Pseudomonas sp. EL_65y_Pfl2_R96 TaxID=3088699 RepID=UPI0030DBCFAB
MEKKPNQIVDFLADIENIAESYVLVREVRLFLEVGHDFWNPEIRIKIWLGDSPSDEPYFYTLSHNVHTPTQAGPYRPSRTCAATEEEALRDAISATRSFLVGAIQQGHEPQDSWMIPNSDY